MGAYQEQLLINLRNHLRGTGWGIRYSETQAKYGIHLVMPEGLEMSEPFQQRIWDILEQLPNIPHPRERVCMTISKPEWDHYYQTIINPNDSDFLTVGTPGGHITKGEWELRMRSNRLSREDYVLTDEEILKRKMNASPIITEKMYIDPELIKQMFEGIDDDDDDTPEDPADETRRGMRPI